jgi:hypothetical protein
LIALPNAHSVPSRPVPTPGLPGKTASVNLIPATDARPISPTASMARILTAHTVEAQMRPARARYVVLLALLASMATGCDSASPIVVEEEPSGVRQSDVTAMTDTSSYQEFDYLFFTVANSSRQDILYDRCSTRFQKRSNPSEEWYTHWDMYPVCASFPFEERRRFQRIVPARGTSGDTLYLYVGQVFDVQYRLCTRIVDELDQPVLPELVCTGILTVNPSTPTP